MPPIEKAPPAKLQPSELPKSQSPQSQPTTTAPADPSAAFDKWARSEIPSLFDVGFGEEKTNFASVGAAAQISIESVDDIFVEILTDLGAPDHRLPFFYLYDVYTRSFLLKRQLSKKDPLFAAKLDFFNAISNSCASYGLICFQAPEMVLNNNLPDTVSTLVNRQETHPLLADVINQAAAQDAVLEVANVIFPQLAAHLHLLNIHNTEYTKYIALWEALVSLKPVSAIFSKVDGFNPRDATSGLQYENKTLLGSILKISPLHLRACSSYFTEGRDANLDLELSYMQLSPIFSSIQSEYKAYFERLWYIMDKLIRGSVQTRQDILKWLADLVNLSHLRTGTYSDPKKLAGDGFMYNISLLLVRLSLPFLDYPAYTKLNKIDADYFGPKNKLLDVKEEQRIYASAKEAESHYAEAMEEETNFISDCFYLTVAYLEYGIGGTIAHYDKMKNYLKNFTQQRETQARRLGPNSRLLTSITVLMNNLKSARWVIDAFSLDRSINVEIFDFIIGATQFYSKVIDPQHLHPKPKLTIPLFQIEKTSQLDDQEFLKTKAPAPWRYLPEYCVEGTINYCKFISRYHRNPLTDNEEKVGALAEFLLALLRCPELVGNPHMKGSIVEIFFYGTVPSQTGAPGFFANLFDLNKLIQENILYSLLDIYVIIEKTGASSQFYDKFNSRFYISKIIEHLWQNTHYKRQLSGYAGQKTEFFIRFIARMLNDTTYLFDESFNELNAIHDMQVEIKRRDSGAEANETDFGTSEELAERLQSSERKATSYMGLANQTMMLFKLFTKLVPEGFTIPELVDRLAGMLDYNLSLMVGPKCSNLKVEQPEKYEFEPKKVLADICQIYTNLGEQSKFVHAVAKDGRSFDFKYFERAKDILMNRTSTLPQLIEQFYAFGQAAEKERISIEQEEQDLGEVPDELLDPLMYTLMEDPVILPGSRVTMDRSTIKSHLLSDPTDPFNRMPLRLEDVIDDVEMREKIAAFKKRD